MNLFQKLKKVGIIMKISKVKRIVVLSAVFFLCALIVTFAAQSAPNSLQNVLVGTWALELRGGGSEVFVYRNDGTFTVSNRGQATDGNYSLDGNKLILTGGFGKKIGEIVEIKKNELIINTEGSTHTYIRQ